MMEECFRCCRDVIPDVNDVKKIQDLDELHGCEEHAIDGNAIV